MKPKPTPSIVQKLNTAERIVGTISARSNKPRPNRRSKLSQSLRQMEAHQKAIRDLGDSIQADEREAFTAGWNAFVARHSSFLISHSIADTRTGLEQAWEKYWKSRKEK
ncbi:MAG TPA: hypothetical protein VFO40_02890 [Chthoniobacterales bacterium]|nr:hypothetical protein [Chthoniobacterales bacterium]